MLSVADIPIPVATGHHGAAFDPLREQEHLKATTEIRRMLVGLINTLEQFLPVPMADADGRVSNVLAQPMGRIPPATHPFQVLQAGEIDEVKVIASPFSVLLKSSSVTDSFTITGLTTIFEPVAGNWLYIEADISAGEPGTNAELKCGATWAGFPAVYDDVGEDQTKCFIPIAYFEAVDDTAEYAPGLIIGNGALQCVQLAHTHIMLAGICTDDGNVLVGIPSLGGQI